MALKFYTSVAKGLKLKIRKLWELIPTFVEVTGKKLEGVGVGGGGGFYNLQGKKWGGGPSPPPPPPH